MNKIKIFMTSLIALMIGVLIALAVILIIYDRRPWIMALVFGAIIIIDGCFGVYIINSSRHYYTKACWLLVITILPLFGCFFFVVFGTLPMTKHKWRQQIEKQLQYAKHEDFEYTNKIIAKSSETSALFKLAYNSELKPIYRSNDIRIIKSNLQTYKEVIKLIRSAKVFIHLETYIIRDGFFFRTLCSELIQQAKKGIKIRLLYDWYGSYRKFKKYQIKELKMAGIEVGVFNPRGINMFKGATNYRLHHKALIIDNQIALYGGSNFGDEYLSIDPKKYHWRDQNYIISGEIVNTLNIAFITDWLDYTDYTVSKEQKKLLKAHITDYLKPHKASTNNEMQLTSSAPNNFEKGVMDTMANLFLKAKKSIKIITPYFIPTELVLSSLIIAARSSIEVEIIVPGKRDNKDFIIPMNRSHYQELLDANISIYEFDGFIHSKCIIVDDNLVFITSSNIDYRSLWMNFENGILINSKNFNAEMKLSFEHEKFSSRLITQSFLDENYTFKTKFQIFFLNLYKPLV